MALDLETLRKEMQLHLDKSGMPIFHGYHHMPDSLIQANWDTKEHPDFREFLKTARAAGAKLVVFNQQSFRLDQIDEALDHLETSDLSRDEKRQFESRLKQLRAYEGFTCALQLSFAVEGCLYLFELHTDWYDSMNDILGELEMATDPFEDEEEEEGPIGGGYFSNN
jgi:hypothetical protein